MSIITRNKTDDVVPSSSPSTSGQLRYLLRRKTNQHWTEQLVHETLKPATRKRKVKPNYSMVPIPSSENKPEEMGAFISSSLVNQEENKATSEAVEQQQPASTPSSKAAAGTNKLITASINTEVALASSECINEPMALDSPSEAAAEEKMIGSQRPASSSSEEEEEPMALDLSVRQVTDEEKENIDPMIDAEEAAEPANEVADPTPEQSATCSLPFKKRRIEEAEPKKMEVESNWKLPNGLIVTFIKATPRQAAIASQEEEPEGGKAAVREKEAVVTAENAAALCPQAELQEAADVSDALVPPGEEKANGKEEEDVTIHNKIKHQLPKLIEKIHQQQPLLSPEGKQQQHESSQQDDDSSSADQQQIPWHLYKEKNPSHRHIKQQQQWVWASRCEAARQQQLEARSPASAAAPRVAGSLSDPRLVFQVKFPQQQQQQQPLIQQPQPHHHHHASIQQQQIPATVQQQQHHQQQQPHQLQLRYQTLTQQLQQHPGSFHHQQPASMQQSTTIQRAASINEQQQLSKHQPPQQQQSLLSPLASQLPSSKIQQQQFPAQPISLQQQLNKFFQQQQQQQASSGQQHQHQQHQHQPPQVNAVTSFQQLIPMPQFSLPKVITSLQPGQMQEIIIAFPLQFLTKLGWNSELEKTLRLGNAKVDAPDASEKTATIYAIESQNHQGLDLLLKAGANPNQADAMGDSLLAIAAKKGDMISLEIISKFSPNYLQENILGEIPILGAVQSRNPEAVNKIWNLMANDTAIISHRTRFGGSFAHYCAAYADVGGLRRLARVVAGRNTALLAPLSKTKQTPLHVACTRDSYACVEQLIRMSPLQLRCVDENMMNPVHHVNNTEALMAIENYYPLELTTVNPLDGASLIHYAAARGNVEVIVYLLKRNRSGPAKDGEKRKWDDIASSQVRDKVAAQLAMTRV